MNHQAQSVEFCLQTYPQKIGGLGAYNKNLPPVRIRKMELQEINQWKGIKIETCSTRWKNNAHESFERGIVFPNNEERNCNSCPNDRHVDFSNIEMESILTLFIPSMLFCKLVEEKSRRKAYNVQMTTVQKNLPFFRSPFFYS